MKKDWRVERQIREEAETRLKHRNTNFKEIRLEIKFLAGILKYKKVFVNLVDSFNSNVLVNDKNKLIYDKIKEEYLSNNTIINSESFMDLPFISDLNKTSYEVLWSKINSQDVTESEVYSARKRIDYNYQLRCIDIGLRGVANNLKKVKDKQVGVSVANKIQEDLEVLCDSLKSVDIEFDISDPISAFNGYKKDYLQYKKNPSLVAGVPTGINYVDRYLLGLRNGELGCISALPGSGKTVALMQCAINCWKYSGDVIFVTIEMSQRQLLERIYSNLTCIDYNKFKTYGMNSFELKRFSIIIQKMKKNPFKMHILDMPNCSIAHIKNRVYNLVNVHDVKLICIDYVNIIRNRQGHIDLGWETQIEMIAQLKLDIARGLNLPVWTASQLTADAKNEAYSSHFKDQLDVGLRLTKEKKDVWANLEFTKERNFSSDPGHIETYYQAMRMQVPDANTLNKISTLNKRTKRRIKL